MAHSPVPDLSALADALLDLPDDSFQPIERPDEVIWDDAGVGGPPWGDRWTTWDQIPAAGHGPEPRPAWLITSGKAIDVDLGVLKTGKEADVHLIRRSLVDESDSCLLAAKRYRGREHSQFTRDDGYTAGRGVRKSRERRAMATKTALGMQLLAQQWAVYEWATLVQMHSAGVAVPYPVSFDDEILMEFIGSDDGVAAPRLAQTSPSVVEAEDWWSQVLEVFYAMASMGVAHGDLSPYNTLVHDGRVVVIDWPQVVDVVANPDGMRFLMRDVENMVTWFNRRGLDLDAGGVFADVLGHL